MISTHQNVSCILVEWGLLLRRSKWPKAASPRGKKENFLQRKPRFYFLSHIFSPSLSFSSAHYSIACFSPSSNPTLWPQRRKRRNQPQTTTPKTTPLPKHLLCLPRQKKHLNSFLPPLQWQAHQKRQNQKESAKENVLSRRKTQPTK